MSPALAVSLYYGLAPIAAIAVAVLWIRRSYGGNQESDR